ncbi:MAG: hypothetical protein FJ104_15410, partial [Deltaproteobacteria bacterium]|nr:hypothetical protein [Deltaproteobacteria bacterium]
MSSPPTATGTLGATPLSNLLIYVLDRRLTGTLVLEDYRARKAAIRLVGGVPLKVRLPEQAHTLAEVAAAEHRLDAPTLESTYDVARATGRLHGAVLVEQGRVTAPDLRRLLAEQVACKVEWLCTLRPDTQFGYYDGHDFLAAYGSHEEPPVEPLAVIRRVIRRGADPALVTATLGRLGDRELRLHAGSRPARFGFDPKERAVVDVLRLKPQPLTALLASGLAPPDATRLIVFTLLATRHLDLGGQAAPVGLDAEPPASLRTDSPPRTQAPP